MNTNSKSLFSRIFASLLIRAGIALIVIYGIYSFFSMKSAIDKIKYAMTPPELPEYVEMDTVHLNPEGWGKFDDHWFHHAPQGTATLPIPYHWLVALEEPKSNPWLIFLGEKKPFMDEYVLRLGFIRSKKSELNPDGMPIGIARTQSINFEGIERKAEAAGFTCAACHTGQLVHDNKRYVIDGGPAVTDLGLLTRSLGAALGQTVLSSKMNIFNGRFSRFAEKVLGSNNNVITRARLKDELTNVITDLSKTSDTILVTEGFTRLDALNRIGNEVFSAAMEHPGNYSPIVAPVNFPHVWTTSWFDWVQYDGSIMQPLIRNAGEALGVKAYLDTTAGQGHENGNGKHQRFASSVQVQTLVEIEDWIGGTHPLANGNRFNGLSAPDWPKDFPPVDQASARAGAVLYRDRCQGCHLPPIDSPEIWESKYWQPIKYVENGEPRETSEGYLKVHVLPLHVVGTDPAQAEVLTTRTVDTTGLNLDTEVCTWAPTPIDQPNAKSMLTVVPLTDSSTSSFALALGAVVERTNEQWFYQNYVPPEQQAAYEGERPNCLQAGKGYKARPLNGIWATAPFLHNGSVATLYDLLSPMEERPVFVELGDQTFDTQHVGIRQSEIVKKLNAASRLPAFRAMDDYKNGRFILDTREQGNHNSGHLFAEKGVPGRVGDPLSESQRLQLIEYLKTL